MKRPPVRKIARVTVEQLELRRLLADVTLNGDQTAAGQADSFLIDRSGPTGRVFVNGAATPTATWLVGDAMTVFVNGLGGSDALRVDFSNGNPLGTGGVAFDGGGGSDQLTFTDSPLADAVSLIVGKVRIGASDLSYSAVESIELNLGRGTDSLAALGDTSLTGATAQVRVSAGGTLKPASGAVWPTSLDVDLPSSATLDLGGVNTAVDMLTGAGIVRANAGNATLTLGNGGSSSVFAGTLTNGSATLSLAKRGAGRVELTGTNTYTGATTVVDGAIRLGNAAALGSTVGNTLIQNGRLELIGGLTINENIDLWARAPDAQNLFTPAIENVGGDNVVAGSLSLNFGGLGYTLQSDTGTLRLVGAVTRVDSSTYDRPLILSGVGNGRIEAPLKTNTAWGIDIRKLDAGAWMVALPDAVRDTQVDAGTLQLRGFGTGTVIVNAGDLRMMPQPQSRDPDGTSVVPSLSIASGGLDLGNNALIIDFGTADPTATVRSFLASGYAGGAWNGAGINSSAATTNSDYAVGYARAADLFTSFPTTYAGKSVDSTSVVVAYTLAGDANLDGKVDFADLLTLSQHYGQADGRWDHGDFNYDGEVDFDDLLVMAQQYNKSFDATQVWQTIPQADFSKIASSSFTNDELRYVLPLYHFDDIVNAVTANGTNKGFIDLKVWRDPADNQPYNARVLENQVWFAFFYSVNRPWNPFYNSQQVRYRLEAIMDFWVASQGPAGTFAEYGAGQYNLAATSFGLRAAVNALELLKAGPPIDAAVHQRFLAATLKGLRAMLQDSTLLSQGNDYSNQYSAVYGSALDFLRLYPEYTAELMDDLRARIPQAMSLHQSPAGFMYEAGASDWAYTLGTHQQNLTDAWHVLRGSEFQDDFVDELTDLYSFDGYNLIRQPNSLEFLSNFGATSRTLGKVFTPQSNPMSEFVPNSRFLTRTAIEEASLLNTQRSSLASNWGAWPALAVPSSNSYSPGGVLDRDRVGWRPTDAQRNASINALPYLAESSFNQQAVDGRRPIQFTFIRRPSFYTTLNSGQQVSSQQRYGIGNLWNPTMGNVLQSQAGSDTQAWGTRATGAARVYEASTLTTAFQLNGSSLAPAVGNIRLASGNLSATYSLGSSAGAKTIAYDDTGISVTVTHAAGFSEEIPLLRKSGETIVLTGGRATLTRNGVSLYIDFPPGVSATVTNSSTTAGSSLTVSVLKLTTSGSLTYRMSFSTSAALMAASPEPVAKRRAALISSIID